MGVANFVTPKVAAKLQLLINKPEAGSWKESSCLAPALDVTKFTTARDTILVTLSCAT